jgi:eukaryotic-like serine/threonine-protein kinase
MAVGVADATGWGLVEGEPISHRLDAVKPLGGGKAFQAYLAWDVRRYTLVVAKLLRPHLVGDGTALAALRREAAALDRLAHPVLPRLLDARLEGERPLIVLELLDGPRLSTGIRRYRLSIEQVLPLALQLCSVLHYLSEEGWVHLDVKPSNVILASQPRLIDLSIARRVEDARRLASPAGTQRYMAPEQCERASFRRIGPPTDMWGLGVTLYEALARRRPFPDAPHGASGRDRYPQLDGDAAPLPESVPPALAELVLRCLERNPEARPTASELADVIEPIEASLPRPRLGRMRPTDR